MQINCAPHVMYMPCLTQVLFQSKSKSCPYHMQVMHFIGRFKPIFKLSNQLVNFTFDSCPQDIRSSIWRRLNICSNTSSGKSSNCKIDSFCFFDIIARLQNFCQIYSHILSIVFVRRTCYDFFFQSAAYEQIEFNAKNQT